MWENLDKPVVFDPSGWDTLKITDFADMFKPWNLSTCHGFRCNRIFKQEATIMIIGTEECQGITKHMIYVGPNQTLKGQTSLVRESLTPGYVGAQFDTVDKYMLGWHQFQETDFALGEVDDS